MLSDKFYEVCGQIPKFQRVNPNDHLRGTKTMSQTFKMIDLDNKISMDLWYLT